MRGFFLQRGANIGIFGLGKTGMSAYAALKDEANVICYDNKESARKEFIKLYGQAPIVNIVDLRWQTLDKIIISPGIHVSHEIVKLAHLHNIPIFTDIDIFFESVPNADFIAVTGTNGKSTTTALISHILQEAGYDYPAGGNIGNAALSLPLDKKGYVFELSSYQLHWIKELKTKVSVLLNVTPDHLDYHNDMLEYTATKEKIFSLLEDQGFGIIGVDNEITKHTFHKLTNTKINLIPISALAVQKNGVAVIENKIYDYIDSEIVLELPRNKSLQGAHNRENIAASYAVCKALGVDSDSIVKSIRSFEGLPHRMQYVGAIDGMRFYNDSKATNSEAASKSISALDNVYWLAGGIAKEGGIDQLEPLFKKIKKAYLFGQDAKLFAKTLSGKVSFEIKKDLQEAFDAAIYDASYDNSEVKNILLAPAAASFDQFKNFEERGNLFIELYKEKI